MGWRRRQSETWTVQGGEKGEEMEDGEEGAGNDRDEWDKDGGWELPLAALL